MQVRFPIWLLGLVALFFAFQALLLQQAWAENPLAQVPDNDSLVYWDWAGRIAEGEWIATQPFQSAPLYPYFLGLLRALGLDLLGVYVVQAALGAATLLLLADATRRRAGVAAGVVAAALWILIDESAFQAGRIWNLPLQLFTGTLLLWYATRIPGVYGIRTMLVLGFLMGLAVLANPALLPVLILLALWAGWAPEVRNLFGSFAAIGVMAAMIAPVTYHNVQASGETILISAQAGLTFSHGNSEHAQGVYTPVPGVSENRLTQNEDARRMAEKATGDGSWAGTSDYFFDRGRSWILGNPGDALLLEARKLWWLLTGRYYADLYNPQFEKRTEFGSRMKLAPLTLAFLIPLGLLGLVLALRRDGLRQRGPELILLLGPVIVVLLFFYSPRYRFPMAPAVVLFAAEALVQAFRAWTDPEQPRRAPAGWVAGMLLAAIAFGQVNRVTRFDHPTLFMPAFYHKVGETLRVQEGRTEEALPYLERAVERGFEELEAFQSLAQAYLRLGRDILDSGTEDAQDRALPAYEKAAENLREVVARNRLLVEAQYNLATIEFWFFELKRRSRVDVRPRIEEALVVARETGRDGLAAELQRMLVQL